MARIVRIEPFMWLNVHMVPTGICTVDSALSPLVDDMEECGCHMEGEEYDSRQIELRLVSKDGRVLDICEGEAGDPIRDEFEALLRREGWLKA